MNLKTRWLPLLAFFASVVFQDVAWIASARGEGGLILSQRTFASPAEAVNALTNAAKAHDRNMIQSLFGPEVTNLLTGDPALDEKHFGAFARDLSERCDLVAQDRGHVTLEIGTNLWLFPIPLIETNGTWFFDTPAGEDEIINRHIGRDEYYAIGVCRTYVKAQREYASRTRDNNAPPKYAERFTSSPGQMDGLYWPAETGGTPSPFSSLVAKAWSEGHHWGWGRGPQPFHGYVFKILTRQGPAADGGKMNYLRHSEMTGGFALVAYPVRWGQSGIMTFIVNQSGIVYQRSLGEKTAQLAAAMREFNPDNQWSVVHDPGIMDLSD